MSNTQLSWAFICLLYLTLGTYVLLLTRWCFVQRQQIKRLPQQVSAALSSAWRVTKCSVTEEPGSNEIILETAVRVQAEKKRLDMYRFCNLAVSPFLVYAISYQLYLKHSDWDFDRQPEILALYDGHTMTAAVTVMFGSLCLLWSKQPIPALRNCLNIFVFARLSWMLFEYPSASHLVFDRTDVMSIRMCASFTLGAPGLTSVLNLVYSAISCNVYASISPTTQMHGLASSSDFLGQEICFCVVICIMGLATDRMLTNDARSSVQVKEARAEKVSLSMLLNTIYDVVVELDDHFRLVENSEKLAALLLQGPGRSLRKMQFLDFMYDAIDREGFQNYIRQEANQGSLQDVIASPIRIRMLDSVGAAIHCMRALARLRDGSAHHLVGVQELADSEDAELLPPMPSELPTVIGCTPSRRLDRGTPRSPRSQNLSSGHSDSSQSDDASSSSSSSRIMLPEFKQTPTITRMMSIIHVMSRWNVQLSENTHSCCTFHGMAKEIRYVTDLLKKKCCMDITSLLCDEWQCPNCFILDMDAESAGFLPERGRCSTCPPPSSKVAL